MTNISRSRALSSAAPWPTKPALAALFFVVIAGMMLLLTALHFGERVLAVEVLDVSETAGKSEASLLYREVNAQ